jgi:hypothetical protein
MASVIHRRQRSAVTALAMATLAAGAIAAFNACSLNSSGLNPPGDAGPDATMPDAGADAATDAAEAGPTPDAPADVIRGDGCAAMETDCLDGIDDDCNGLTDCADPACAAGYACVPTPSPASGFSGFGIYAPTRTSPCPAAYPASADAYEGLVYLPATCTACSCLAAGGSCGTATMTCNNGGSCDADGGVSTPIGEGCSAEDGGITLGPASACSVSVPATAGSCSATGGVSAADPVTFDLLSRVCAATKGPGGGCAMGSSCVAKPATGFHGACVLKATDSSALCPAGYLNAHVTMPDGGSFTDTRSCTACSCTGPAGAACEGAVSLYPSSGCDSDSGSAVVTVPADGNCHSAATAGTEAIGSTMFSSGIVSQGSCLPDGGQPSGAVKPKNQTIYCCQD